MTEKLKPCPFCGRSPYIQKRPVAQKKCIYAVKCHCGVLTHFMERQYKAIEVWNTRKPMERIVEQLEEEKSYSCSPQYNKAIDRAIKIVKRGGVDD